MKVASPDQMFCYFPRGERAALSSPLRRHLLHALVPVQHVREQLRQGRGEELPGVVVVADPRGVPGPRWPGALHVESFGSSGPTE